MFSPSKPNVRVTPLLWEFFKGPEVTLPSLCNFLSMTGLSLENHVLSQTFSAELYCSDITLQLLDYLITYAQIGQNFHEISHLLRWVSLKQRATS